MQLSVTMGIVLVVFSAPRIARYPLTIDFHITAVNESVPLRFRTAMFVNCDAALFLEMITEGNGPTD